MNTRRIVAAPVTLRWALGILLVLVSLSAHSQSGPIVTQNLFFNDASGAHLGNYLDAQAGLIYTDNVSLAPNGSGDTLAMIGLVGDTSRVGAPRLDYHFDSDISLVKYFSNTYETQPFGYADADGEFKIVPGLFSWVGRATFNQVVLDPSLPATPLNLESITYLTTGPKFTFRPTLQTTVILGGVYSYVATNSKSPLYVDIDSSRYGADAKVSRAFTNTISAYVSAAFDRVKFVDTIENTDFDMKTATVGFTYGTARTQFNGSFGYTQIELYPQPGQVNEITDTTPAGTTYAVDISHLLTPTQRLTLHVSKQISDAADLFRFNLDQPVPVTQQNRFLTDQPLAHREYGGSWRIEGTRTTLQIGVLASSDRYEITPTANRDGTTLNAFLTRQLNSAFIWELGVSHEHDTYDNGGTINTTTALTTLRWRVGPRVSVRFIYGYSSISPNNASANQIGATISYALTEAAQAQDKFTVPMTPNSRASQPLLQ